MSLLFLKIYAVTCIVAFFACYLIMACFEVFLSQDNNSVNYK